MSSLRHSFVLFVGVDGRPLEFFMRSCPEKTKLKPLIEHGGGFLHIKSMPGRIRLVEPGSKVFNFKEDEEVLSTQYIYDCVAQNRLLDRKDYTVKLSSLDTSDISEDGSQRGESLKRAAEVISHPIEQTNRFTDVEVEKIARFILEHKEDFLNRQKFDFCKLIYASGILKRSLRDSLRPYVLMLKSVDDLRLSQDIKDRLQSLVDEKKNRLFTKDDDLMILSYIFVNECGSGRHGRSVWARMKSEKKFPHSARALCYRFHKTILPNIHSYGLAPFKVQEILAKVNSLLPAYGSDSQEDVGNSDCLQVQSPRKRPRLGKEVGSSGSGDTGQRDLRKSHGAVVDSISVSPRKQRKGGESPLRMLHRGPSKITDALHSPSKDGTPKSPVHSPQRLHSGSSAHGQQSPKSTKSLYSPQRSPGSPRKVVLSPHRVLSTVSGTVKQTLYDQVFEIRSFSGNSAVRSLKNSFENIESVCPIKQRSERTRESGSQKNHLSPTCISETPEAEVIMPGKSQEVSNGAKSSMQKSAAGDLHQPSSFGSATSAQESDISEVAPTFLQSQTKSKESRKDTNAPLNLQTYEHHNLSPVAAAVDDSCDVVQEKPEGGSLEAISTKARRKSRKLYHADLAPVLSDVAEDDEAVGKRTQVLPNFTLSRKSIGSKDDNRQRRERKRSDDGDSRSLRDRKDSNDNRTDSPASRLRQKLGEMVKALATSNWSVLEKEIVNDVLSSSLRDDQKSGHVSSKSSRLVDEPSIGASDLPSYNVLNKAVIHGEASVMSDQACEEHDGTDISVSHLDCVHEQSAAARGEASIQGVKLRSGADMHSLVQKSSANEGRENTLLQKLEKMVTAAAAEDWSALERHIVNDVLSIISDRTAGVSGLSKSVTSAEASSKSTSTGGQSSVSCLPPTNSSVSQNKILGKAATVEKCVQVDEPEDADIQDTSSLLSDSGSNELERLKKFLSRNMSKLQEQSKQECMDDMSRASISTPPRDRDLDAVRKHLSKNLDRIRELNKTLMENTCEFQVPQAEHHASNESTPDQLDCYDIELLKGLQSQNPSTAHEVSPRSSEADEFMSAEEDEMRRSVQEAINVLERAEPDTTGYEDNNPQNVSPSLFCQGGTTTVTDSLEVLPPHSRFGSVSSQVDGSKCDDDNTVTSSGNTLDVGSDLAAEGRGELTAQDGRPVSQNVASSGSQQESCSINIRNDGLLPWEERLAFLGDAASVVRSFEDAFSLIKKNLPSGTSANLRKKISDSNSKVYHHILRTKVEEVMKKPVLSMQDKAVLVRYLSVMQRVSYHNFLCNVVNTL